MARFGNRVKESTETTGTGTLDLSGAPTGFRAFGDEFTSGDDDISYLIVDDPDNPTDYEYGKGTFTSGTPDTLSRDTVEGSSNSGNKVSFTSGTKTVIATPLAADFNFLAAFDDAFDDVASATTTDIGAATSRNVRITGTTTITGLGTVAAGTTRRIRFAGALTFTHNGTSLILPGAANITTAANDTAVAVSLGSGNWVVTQYQRANGLPVTDASAAKAWADFAATGGTVAASYNVDSVTDNATGDFTVNFGTDFSSADYAAIATLEVSAPYGDGTTGWRTIRVDTGSSGKAVGSCRFMVIDNGGTPARKDTDAASVVFYGAQ